MRRILVLLTMVALGVVLSAGVALALNQIDCASIQQYPDTPSCYGTPENDVIDGRNAEDIIYAKAGDDYVAAHAGNDVVYSGAGVDFASGDEGDDQLYGARGADHLTDKGNQNQVGGDTDEQSGGKGNDSLSGYDSDYNDTLVCGAGTNDTVYFDRTTGARDTVSDTCENRRPNQSDGF
jgi:RTX calcium-binding nonapeptide repeat (4 copies)